MTILIITSAIAVAALVIPLAVVVHGIRRQERAGLDSQDAGLCAALTRKLLGLHAAPQSQPEQARRDASRRAAFATAGARP